MKVSDIKTMSKLASYIAAKEDGKSIVSIGDVREILKVLSDASLSNPNVLQLIYKNGRRRKGKK